MLIMPWVWDAFPRDEWLLTNAGEPDECESPPAFVSCPSWDRINTSEDYDFSIHARRLGIKLVSANRVSGAHCYERIDPEIIGEVLRRLSELPSVGWFRHLSQALNATTDLVVVGEHEPSADFVDKLQRWCVDFDHPARSRRFLCAHSPDYLITTAANVPLIFFGAPTRRWAISYPEAKRLPAPGSSPRAIGSGELPSNSERAVA